jgi:hypothetical protein
LIELRQRASSPNDNAPRVVRQVERSQRDRKRRGNEREVVVELPFPGVKAADRNEVPNGAILDRGDIHFKENTYNLEIARKEFKAPPRPPLNLKS